MKHVLMSLAVLALLSLATVTFAAPLDDGTGPGELNTPNETYVNVYGDPYESAGAVYDYSEYEWVGGTESGVSTFTVRCDVEMWLNMHLNAHDIYYHKANATTSMSAIVGGWLQSNNGQYLFVALPPAVQGSDKDGETYLSQLVFQRDGFGRQIGVNGHVPSGVSDPIPMTWELQDRDPVTGVWSGWGPMAYSTGGNAGSLWGMTKLLAGGQAGHIAFEIKNTISPAAYQSDGEYEMDPIIACAPEL